MKKIKKMKRKKIVLQKRKTGISLNKGAKASLWSVSSNILCRGIGFLFTPIFTRALSPTEYGIYPLYTSLMGIFTPLITLEATGGFIYRLIAGYDERKKARFLSSLLTAELILSLFFAALYLVFRKGINSLTSLSTSLTVLLILQIFLNTAEGIYFAERRYSGDFKTVSFINIARGFAVPILSLFMIWLGFSGRARIYAPLLVSSLISLPIIVKIIKDGGFSFEKRVFRYIFKLLLPMLPHYLSTALIASSDKIIIARILGSEAVGRYSAVYSIGFMTSLITGGLMLVLSPWITKRLKSGRCDEISSVCSASVKVIIFFTLLFLSVLPEVLRLVISREYYESGLVAYVASLAVVFSFLSSFLQTVLLYYEKPFIITKNSLVSALITILLLIALVRGIGYVGGAVSALVSYFILFLENAVSVYRNTPHKKILNVKSYLEYFAFMFAFAALIFFLRYSLLARSIIIIALILIILPEIKSYKKILT